MKKLLLAVACVLLLAVAAVFTYRAMPAGSAVAAEENEKVSAKAAKSLQDKIDAIKKAENSPDHAPGCISRGNQRNRTGIVHVIQLKEDIPARMDSFDVQLEPVPWLRKRRLTFTSDATGNPISMQWSAALMTCSLKARCGGPKRVVSSTYSRYALMEFRCQ